MIFYSRPPSRRPSPGFTLPELLITILLLSILFSAGIVLSSSMRSTKKMRNYEIAIALTQQAIEAIQSVPFDLIDDADAKENSIETDLNTSTGDVDLFEPSFITSMVKYERKVEIQDVPPKEKDGTPVRLKHVKVTVNWKPPDGDTLTYEITTTVSDIN